MIPKNPQNYVDVSWPNSRQYNFSEALSSTPNTNPEKSIAENTSGRVVYGKIHKSHVTRLKSDEGTLNVPEGTPVHVVGRSNDVDPGWSISGAKKLPSGVRPASRKVTKAIEKQVHPEGSASIPSTRLERFGDVASTGVSAKEKRAENKKAKAKQAARQPKPAAPKPADGGFRVTSTPTRTGR